MASKMRRYLGVPPCYKINFLIRRHFHRDSGEGGKNEADIIGQHFFSRPINFFSRIFLRQRECDSGICKKIQNILRVMPCAVSQTDRNGGIIQNERVQTPGGE